MGDDIRHAQCSGRGECANNEGTDGNRERYVRPKARRWTVRVARQQGRPSDDRQRILDEPRKDGWCDQAAQGAAEHATGVALLTGSVSSSLPSS